MYLQLCARSTPQRDALLGHNGFAARSRPDWGGAILPRSPSTACCNEHLRHLESAFGTGSHGHAPRAPQGTRPERAIPAVVAGSLNALATE
jgi:hypothetical protein